MKTGKALDNPATTGEEQLAAEREKHIVSEGLLIEANKELTHQLAAEREKHQTLVYALKLMPGIAYKAIIEGAGVTVENLPNELQCICDAALKREG